MTSLMEVNNVSKVFHSGPSWKRESTVAVDRVSFSLPDDQPSITGIVGESGSGKTTLALMLLDNTRPSDGKVIFRGKDITTLSALERLDYRREVQPIFQDPFAAFNPFYRVDHVLEVPIKRFRLASSSQEGRELIHEALEMVGLRPAETLGRFPHQLSGGQRQRLMVARALICQPKLIIADEPVSMVDASLRATILASLQMLNREHNISIVYITHDLTTAYQVCGNLIVMYAGSVVEAGAIEKVIQSPQHPYTQLLISSIPSVDRSKRWAEDAEDETASDGARTSKGCSFAPRCPLAVERCWVDEQPLRHVEEERAVACVQFEESPHLENQDIATVFRHKK